MTTAPRPLRPSEVQARERAREQETPERDAEGVEDDGGNGERLKIIPAQAHRPAGTMHLTLGTMVLSDVEEMRRALEVLRSVDFGGMLRGVGQAQGEATRVEEETADSTTLMDAGEEVASALKTLGRSISPPPASTATVADDSSSRPRGSPNTNSISPLKLDLKGLGTFPSPKKSRVFYASPHDPSGRLQTFAEVVQRRFIQEGIVRDEGRALTLHATVANLKYVRTPKWHGRQNAVGAKRGGREGKEIDARDVIAAFNINMQPQGGDQDDDVKETEGYLWAKDIVVDRIRICKMGAVKSEDPVKGMEYPAIRVPRQGDEGGEGDVAEVVFGS